MRFRELTEGPIINLSKKIFQTLSPESQNAIEMWESGGWDIGPLQRAVNSNSDIAKEIFQKSQPIRDMLKKKGPTIHLYRGLRNDPEYSPSSTRTLESWTSDRRVAEVFANLRTFDRSNSHPSNLFDPISDQEVQQAVDTYNRTGFVTFYGKKYRRSKDNPEIFDIYDRYNHHITDGEDIHSTFKEIQSYINELNAERASAGKVIEDDIDVDRIV